MTKNVSRKIDIACRRQAVLDKSKGLMVPGREDCKFAIIDQRDLKVDLYDLDKQNYATYCQLLPDPTVLS